MKLKINPKMKGAFTRKANNKLNHPNPPYSA